MRWYAAATISLTLFAAVFGCSSDGHGGFIAPPEDDGSGGKAIAGSAGTNPAGSAGSDTEPLAGSGGDAGSPPDEGDGGATDADAGAAQGGSAASGGGAPVTTLPRAPTDLVLKVASASSVHLSWTDNADNETGYDVYWSTTSVKPAQPNKKLNGDATSGVAEGLTMGKEYTFWVEAHNDLGSSSAITGQAIPLPVPAAPTGLTIQPGPTDAVLSWTDAAVAETGYRIYVSTSKTQPAVAQYELPADASTFTVTASDIDAYTKYYYWVVAYNSAGESIAATVSGTTGVLPQQPTGVVVDATASVWSVAVSWLDNSEHSSSFNIYWSIDDSKPALPSDTVPGDTTTYKMKSVLANKLYRFWIESVNSLATSAASKATAATATYELPWTDLYYDPIANTIHQASQDVFGLVTDNDSTTGLYAYHTTNQTLGTAATMNPAVNWSPASAGIDVSVTESFWTEARTPFGSSFSVRNLNPPGALGALTAMPNPLTVALSLERGDVGRRLSDLQRHEHRLRQCHVVRRSNRNFTDGGRLESGHGLQLLGAPARRRHERHGSAGCHRQQGGHHDGPGGGEQLGPEQNRGRLQRQDRLEQGRRWQCRDALASRQHCHHGVDLRQLGRWPRRQHQPRQAGLGEQLRNEFRHSSVRGQL